MAQPPKSTPHSDIDGVHRDERRNIDTANAAGQDGADLERANAEDVARPEHRDEEGNLDSGS